MRRLATLAAMLCSMHLSGTTGLTVDYLYWKPTNFSYDLGNATVINADGRRLNTQVTVDAPYHSGVRGEAWWNPCEGAFTYLARYYWTESRHSQTFANEVQIQPLGVGTVTPRVETLYHAADLLVAYNLFCSSCLTVSLLGGGEVLYAALNQKVTTAGTLVNRIETHTRLAGGGFTVGAAADWELLAGVGLFAEARYGMIFGSSLVALQEDISGTIAITTPHSSSTWTREVDLRLGGRYGGECGCTSVSIELGWEVRAYSDFLAWQIPLIFSGASFPSTTPDLGKALGGPFIGLFVSF